jgi:hypothetical protein
LNDTGSPTKQDLLAPSFMVTKANGKDVKENHPHLSSELYYLYTEAKALDSSYCNAEMIG